MTTCILIQPVCSAGPFLCFYRACINMLTPRLQGVGAYNAGDIQRAIQQFKAAAPSKGVLFNLGVSTAKLGDNQVFCGLCAREQGMCGGSRARRCPHAWFEYF